MLIKNHKKKRALKWVPFLHIQEQKTQANMKKYIIFCCNIVLDAQNYKKSKIMLISIDKVDKTW